MLDAGHGDQEPTEKADKVRNVFLNSGPRRKHTTKSAADLSAGYESNFGMEGDEGCAGGLVGTAKGVESVVIAVIYQR